MTDQPTDEGLSAARHTPGPWEIIDGDRPGIDGIDWSVVMFGDISEDEQIGVQGRTPDEMMANARLIAAAPNLLEACRESMEAMRANLAYAQRKDEHVLLDAFRKCEAAIAAATADGSSTANNEDAR